MPIINLLPPHLADLIAAGEVVERPASVIKELMENSFDAHATAVTVEIRNGGADYIRVTDDGCGMAPEDAGVAFLRHATSKLHDEYGLEAIGTMGFRGEALAAISAVSEIELYTRRKGDSEGTFISLLSGDIQQMHAVGCREGSSMTVKRLFFNTPARLKFLKSDRSEASSCVQTALRCALGRPDISVRFIRDGREEFFSPGDSRKDSAMYTLLGRELAKDMLPCSATDDKYTISGFVSSPSAGRGSRSAQFFYCNRRFIRSTLLQSAVEQAYKNRLLTGRFPSCVLYLDMSPAAVDVNVHPAKTEVKFAEDKRIFDLVYNAVLSALDGETRTDEASVDFPPVYETAPKAETSSLSPVKKPLTAKSTARADFYRNMTAEEYRKELSKAPSNKDSSPAEYSLRSNKTAYIPETETPRLNLKPKSFEVSRLKPSDEVENVEKPVQNVESSVIADHKILGELFKTYILVEQGESMLLIDKHAAHERLNFDRLKKQGVRPMSQTLLESVTLRLTGEQSQVLEANGELMQELGFEIEPFGEDSFVIRSVPADIDAGDAKASVEEICEKLINGKRLSPEDARDEILHTVACKAAIKAGWDTQEQELEGLVRAVISGEIKYCPHGRPVCVRLKKYEIEKMFGRV